MAAKMVSVVSGLKLAIGHFNSYENDDKLLAKLFYQADLWFLTLIFTVYFIESSKRVKKSVNLA